MADAMIPSPPAAARAAPAVPAAAGLADAIRGCDETTWKRLAAALGVGSREEAVTLVETDEEAARIASEILAGTKQTFLTTPSAKSMVTAPAGAGAAAPLAERLYPKGKAGRLTFGG